jgi:hypothetical protein
MTTETTSQPNVLTFEAPASWNTRYLTPDGFECQLTLRGESGMDLLEKVQGAIAFLLKNGCTPSINIYSKPRPTPTPSNNGHNGSAEQSNGNDPDERSFCPIHQCTMKRWEKDGRVWYSHKAGDQWCTGKAKTR